MTFNNWRAMESAMRGSQPQQRITRATLRRVFSFARPHLGELIVFLVLSVIGAVLTVATPVIAGRIVDEITTDGSARSVVTLAIAIAVIAVAAAAFGMIATVGVGEDRRGRHPRPAPRGVRARAADAGGVLHAHPHRSPRQPAQQRRDRRPAGVHLHAVGRGHQHHRPRADAGRDAAAVVVDHPARARPAAAVRDPGAAHGRPARPDAARGGHAQRRHDDADDGALLGAGRHAGEAVRPARARGVRVRRPRRAGRRDRRALGDGPVGVHDGARVGVGARPGARVRARRLPRRPGAPRGRHGGDAGAAARPALRPAHRARQRPRRHDDGARQLRAGVRGARPRTADHRAPGRRRRAAGAGERRARRRALLLPVGRQGVAGVARGGRHARPARRGRGAPRRVVRAPSPDASSPSSARRVAGSRRSPR